MGPIVIVSQRKGSRPRKLAGWEDGLIMEKLLTSLRVQPGVLV